MVIERQCSVHYREYIRERAARGCFGSVRVMKLVDSPETDKFYEGSSCKNCGSTTKYSSNNNCVKCVSKKDKLRYKRRL